MKTINEVMRSKIENLELSVRSSNCMKKVGIRTLEDLTKFDVEKLKTIKSLGAKSFEEIKQKLSDLDLTFNMNDKAWVTWGLAHLQLIKTLCWEMI